MNRKQEIIRLCSVFAVALILLAAFDFGYANARIGKNGINSKNDILNGWTFIGSKQGQSIGFVDVDGDGIDDKLVGAPYAFSSSNIGSVLVYKGIADGYFSVSPFVLLAGDDNYGYSFVNLGDVDDDGKEDFAIGAINGNGPDSSLSGSVTVYKGGRSWNYNEGRAKAITKLSGEKAMEKFGLSISSGDLNVDGRKDLIVGAPFNTNDPAIYQGGAVYVYFAPEFTKKVILHASSQSKGLGWSSAEGDINGDGISDLCISAGGKVLCYYGKPDFNPSIDLPDVMIKSSSAGFGKALAISGDLNGDGFGEILIGAPNAVINGNRDTGSVYVVKGGTGKRTINVDESLSSDLIVRIDGETLFNRFGSSIAAVSDVDGDKKVAIGAPLADSGTLSMAGKVYIFNGKNISSAATLAESAVFAGFARDQGYGTTLAAARNGRLLIGAPRTDRDTGSVIMVDLSTGQVVPGGDIVGSRDLSREYDPFSFSAEGRKLQPAPSGIVQGKDNGDRGTHNAGEECGICHRPNGKAKTVFTASGTLYEDRAGRRPLKGGEVILQDIDGNVISMTSNEVGNFWTFAPIASNPYAVASHGGMTEPLYYYDDQGIFHPAEPNDSRSWQYKAWVRNGDTVMHMVTIAPIGGATDPTSRMSCSMHHACMGNRGALWGTGKATLASYPHSNLSLKRHILPIFINKCATCHIPGDTMTRIATRSDFDADPSTRIDYSKSLDLTSYNGSNITVSGKTWIKRGIKDVTTGYSRNADSSPVLGRTIRHEDGIIVHPGGEFWSSEDADYRALRKWIEEGARNN
ncbi:MAG TPA: hypothetical protein VN316_01470 [candidate division Zixibacteria bacterium]|nr:hypothetical protein [candidate division Zixibacteria bacterium]